jgi:hypothetical protein
MERNIRTFDLSNPIEAFQFATFLLRLREQSEKLKTLFEEKKNEIIQKAQGHELAEWTKEAQTESNSPGETDQNKVHADVEVGQ